MCNGLGTAVGHGKSKWDYMMHMKIWVDDDGKSGKHGRDGWMDG